MYTKKGLENTVVDALFRPPTPMELSAISFCTPKWLSVVAEGYQVHSADKELLQELALTGKNDKGYALLNGIIRYKDIIWLGHNTKAHQAIMLALHNSGIGGHSGFQGTYKIIKELFAWPAMKQNI